MRAKLCQQPLARWSSSKSSPSDSKPYYATTPIFYVNAAPHIGHLYTMVLTDVMKRWQQMKGKEAILCTGTDEHGMKIQQAASKQLVDPKEFCDANSQKFRDLAAAGNIANDFFIRTTDEEHKKAVGDFWLHLKHQLPDHLGLYKGSRPGWYCVSDECFYPADMVKTSIEPQTGKKITINTETDKEVEWVEEETWYFPLTKYKDALLKFYKDNPEWITPAHRMKEVEDWVTNHLEDLSVTRPVSRLNWGISDPEDPSQTIYVWVDALINYLTKAGYGSKWHSPKEDMGLWPADLQVIGKDILRFHGVYWPALLMALGLPLPKKLLCHNHWTMSNRKMSKSVGNVVNPFYAIQRFGVDPLRYFLMRNGSLSKDMDYSNNLIAAVYEKELQANIGNLFYRVARPKATGAWSTEEAVTARRNGDFKVLDEFFELEDTDPAWVSLESRLDEMPGRVIAEMDKLDPAGALRELFLFTRDTNRYITDTAPWNVVKQEGKEGRILLNWIIWNGSEALRLTALLLQPIMPEKATRLLDELNVKPERRTLEYAALGKDLDYGGPARVGAQFRDKWHSLFPPLPSDAVDVEEDPLQKSSAQKKPKYARKLRKMTDDLSMESTPKYKAEKSREQAGVDSKDKLGNLNHTQNEDQPIDRLAPDCIISSWSNVVVAIASSKALLVPYEARHVLTYHAWMQDPEIQQATASEPLTLDEEYENQQSWRAAHDKLTFIVCAPDVELQSHGATAGKEDADAKMKGDVNFFLHAYQDEDGDEHDGWLTGEVDVMIADKAHRGQGLGRASVCALLVYLHQHLGQILQEHDSGAGTAASSELKGLMVKIQESNVASRALFQKLGFKQQGDVNYFGEVMLALKWDDLVSQGWWQRASDDYHEVEYKAV
ncbi:putative methionine--tRNA ligase [Paramyrothecium foliicola]|nr:putative methionine--tRNA ligase [Paramyrothecium foliicola]